MSTSIIPEIVLSPQNGQKDGQNNSQKISAWQEPSPASHDFRSDTTTTATPFMLRAVASSGLNDGWSGTGAGGLETMFTRLCSREAALFMVSSTMSNQISLRAHLNQPPVGVICDERSHIIHMEAGGMASLSGALPQMVRPANGLYLTLEDIRGMVVLSDGSDACTTPTRVIHLENPLGGVIMPLKELRRIKHFAKNKGIKVHMDGSRLWEAVVLQAGSLSDYCAQADSVNLCLTKGIGAPIGSIIVGDKEFIHRARWIRKSVGGTMRQPGIVASLAQAAVEEAFGTDPCGKHSLLRGNNERARRIASVWQQVGGKLVVPPDTNMVWLDLEAAGFSEDEWEQLGLNYGLKLHSSRLVIHYQQSTEAISQLENVIRTVMASRPGKAFRNTCPRNDAVSRLAARMKEAAYLATLEKGSGQNGWSQSIAT